MKTTSSNTSKNNHSRLFAIAPRHIMIVACVLIVAGYALMSGSGSTEQSFNPDIFSTRRVIIAPILCLAGYLLIVIGILYKSSDTTKQASR